MADADRGITRRALIAGAAATAGSALVGGVQLPGSAQADTAPVPPPPPVDPTRAPGAPTSVLGERSPFVELSRSPAGAITGSSYSPIHKLTGTITPSDLHFERHHSGVPSIDPRTWKLLVHGLVERPLAFTLEDLRRFPAIARTCFIECSGNGRTAYRKPARELTPQDIDGMTANSEWTGVPLALLLREAGVRSPAKWVLAEGGDSSKLARSIPLEKAMDDAIVAYAQNGEPIRPANGYPVRLVLPGWEANTCIKWLRRIEAVERPAMFRDETSRYTDPLPDGTARQFSFVMDAKSIITSPAHPERIGRGWVPITGIAWSGRGRIARVDVSTDGGSTWTEAELQAPVLSKAHTRFRLMWQWDGRPSTLMSRAVDETGYVQPTLAAYRERRGAGTDYHFNAIRGWTVQPDGSVHFDAGA